MNGHLNLREIFAVALVAIFQNGYAESAGSIDTSDKEGDQIAEVVVTASVGSFVERDITQQPIPVISISREQMAQDGKPTMSRLL